MLLRTCVVGLGLLVVALTVLLCVLVEVAEEFVFLLSGSVASPQDVELTREK
jgi:hypothetical protein